MSATSARQCSSLGGCEFPPHFRLRTLLAFRSHRLILKLTSADHAPPTLLPQPCSPEQLGTMPGGHRSTGDSGGPAPAGAVCLGPLCRPEWRGSGCAEGGLGVPAGLCERRWKLQLGRTQLPHRPQLTETRVRVSRLCSSGTLHCSAGPLQDRRCRCLRAEGLWAGQPNAAGPRAHTLVD